MCACQQGCSGNLTQDLSHLERESYHQTSQPTDGGNCVCVKSGRGAGTLCCENEVFGEAGTYGSLIGHRQQAEFGHARVVRSIS